MQQFNNLDVVLFIITAISALVALYRGLIKEVLSIVGWILAAIIVFYLLPVLTPIAKIYIASSLMASFVTSLVILIVFYIVWLLSTDKMIGKIRTSKLSSLDRILGLLFGLLRAFLLVVLFNILLTWIIPESVSEGMFKESRYFRLAGEFAKPIESLIPEETINLIRDKSLGQISEDKKEKEPKKEEEEKSDDIDALFQKLAQPQIKAIVDEKKAEIEKDFKGYQENEADNLDRLIETTVD